MWLRVLAGVPTCSSIGHHYFNFTVNIDCVKCFLFLFFFVTAALRTCGNHNLDFVIVVKSLVDIEFRLIGGSRYIDLVL